MFHLGNYVSNGWTDPTKRVQNLGILKNGSTYISTNVENWGWSMESILLSNKRVKRFTVLREPYLRWLSGFAEDLGRYVSFNADIDNKKYIEDLFINSNAYWFFDFLIDKDIMKFDSHADLQRNQIKLEIEEIGLFNIGFLKMNDRLGDALNHWLGSNNIPSYFTNAKVHQTNTQANLYYKRLVDYFSDPRNESRKKRVLEYLAPDYELFNTVNFINPA
jgi:hypothetical protein